MSVQLFIYCLLYTVHCSEEFRPSASHVECLEFKY